MFKEALQKAPREELVEHIRLQRALIQRLHRRVLELEASLERACVVTRSTAADSDGNSDARRSPSRDTRETPVKSQQQQHRSTASSSMQASATSPQARRPAWDSSTLLPRRPSPPRETHAERKSRSGTGFSADGAAAAPEPRRDPPRPHTDERRASSSTASPLPPPPTTARAVDDKPALGEASQKPTLVPAVSSADHPTVLEGVKEINYVLAAHRAGRPSLPLPVVEELEEIRDRLLQNFKLMWLRGSAVAAEEEREVHRLQHESWVGAGDSQDDTARVRLDFIRQSYGAAGREGEAVCRVQPRWVSPESSRVVYGDSPHRRW